MNTGSKILLLTDFSEVAGNAASYAKLIASKINGQIEIMHILETPVNWVKLPQEREQFYPETKKEIASAKAKLSEMVRALEISGVKAVASLIYSFGPENVFSHVQNSKADLAIMGSRGMGISRGFLLGSNALKVLRNVKTPILVVQKPSEKSEIKKIAFLTTLEADQEPVYARVKDFANLMGAEIDLIFINTPYNFFENEETDRKFAKFTDHSVKVNRVLINAHNMERGILFYSENYTPDLLVLAKSDKPGLVKLFSPSLTENLVQEHDFPVLSISIA
ncbi:universal stress protein [Algoriphagus sp.]|uniref:universal stress protein n=1 Tax=Algoriphagus sp. TaxID=1872435 RepID=UPI00391B32F9